jgi:hypothetical protein
MTSSQPISWYQRPSSTMTPLFQKWTSSTGRRCCPSAFSCAHVQIRNLIMSTRGRTLPAPSTRHAFAYHASHPRATTYLVHVAVHACSFSRARGCNPDLRMKRPTSVPTVGIWLQLTVRATRVSLTRSRTSLFSLRPQQRTSQSILISQLS